MPKRYNDRSMAAGFAPVDPLSETFFFPKNNPPIAIRARTREEAERALEALNRKEV